MKATQNHTQGFTLIELMIVVAILGILAAVAIPNFLQYQARSRTGEVKSNLAAIRTAELSYFGEYGTYAGDTGPTLPHPALPVFPSNQKQNWNSIGFCQPSPCFADEITWIPEGPVFYSYGVAIETDSSVPPRFVAYAVGDVDGDSASGGGTAVFAFVNTDSTGNANPSLCTPWCDLAGGDAPFDAVGNPLYDTVAQYQVSQGFDDF